MMAGQLPRTAGQKGLLWECAEGADVEGVGLVLCGFCPKGPAGGATGLQQQQAWIPPVPHHGSAHQVHLPWF